MRLSEYQVEASKHINRNRLNRILEFEALHGMAQEVGNINGLYIDQTSFPEGQDVYKKRALGELLFYISQYLTVNDWTLEDIAEENLDTLNMR